MSRYRHSFLICIALLMAMGLLMVFDTTAAEVIDRSLERSTYHAVLKQIFYGILGGVGAVFITWLGYQNVLKLSGVFLLIATIMLLLVYVPGVGMYINGAHRWLGIFGYSFQPSELVKYLIPVYYIHVITSHSQGLTLLTFFKLMGTLAIPTALILMEPDTGTVAIIMVSLIFLFILTRIKWVYWALPLSIFLVGGVAIASQMEHIPGRIRVYLHPELDLKGKGHQPHQAKIAAGSGKLVGRGVGESLQKLDYLPEARSDYIAAIFAEEFGFLGILGLIFLYMMIGFLGFCLANQACDREGFYLIAILTFLICFQAFLNLGVVSGLLPSKGTNLPFFSHGGSSLFANMMVVALILNIAKTSEKKYAK